MKRLIILLVMGSSLLGFAQGQEKQKKMQSEFSPEQQAILKTKKMALELDLTDSQQKQMLVFNEKWATVKAEKRAEMKNMNREDMSSTDKFNHMNAMLDHKLAHQKEIKSILNEEQYDAWKKSAQRKHKRGKGKGENQHGKGQKGKK